MKKENVDRLLQSVDKQFQILGFKDWDEGIEFALAVLTNLTTKLRDIRNRSQLEKKLLKEDDLTDDQLEEATEAIAFMFSMLRKQILEFAKAKVPRHRGGRRKRLGLPSKRRERVKKVLSLIEKGVKTTDALKRVSQAEGISLSSMYRIWRMRSKN